MLAVRRAGLHDARSLAELAETTFRDTFAVQNTEEDMRLHCERSYGETLQAAEIASPDRITWLAEAGGRLVGYAQVRWAEAPACVAASKPGEVQRLYVVKDWQGRGVAQALMHASLAAIGERGSDVAWLGVWERNLRAISFYRKFGFAEVGAHVFPLGQDPQRDIVMARPV